MRRMELIVGVGVFAGEVSGGFQEDSLINGGEDEAIWGVDRRVNRGLGGHGEEIFLRVGLLSPSPSVPPSLLLLVVSAIFSLSLCLSLSLSGSFTISFSTLSFSG